MITGLCKEVVKFCAACLASIQRTFASHLPLYFCTVVFLVSALTIATAYGAPLSFWPSLMFLRAVPMFFLIGIFLIALTQYLKLAFKRSDKPLRAFGGWLYGCTLAKDQVGNAFHSLVTLLPLLVSFLALKANIPLIHPFSWDETFMRWDRALGFGHAPWELLQLGLGIPAVTSAINIVYASWFFVMFGILFWQAFFARGTLLRMQYLLSFAISWLIAGTALALFLSSAGPCFYGYLHTSDPYAGQIAYLRSVDENSPIWTVRVQDLLWMLYTHGANIGISAMPSLHVVTSVLMAMVGWRTHRWLGVLLTIFAAIIVVGSVHLAWHYAVDSLAGIFLAIGFWWLAGAILNWNARRTSLSLQAAPSGGVSALP